MALSEVRANHTPHIETVYASPEDFLGLKPLYYAQVDEACFLVSDDIGELIARLPQQPDLSFEYLARAFCADYRQCSVTPYVGVAKVPPGQVLQVRQRDGELSATLTQHWLPPKVTSVHGRDAAEQLRQLVEDAVSKSLVSARTTVAECSGGLDSSVICALVRGQIADDGYYFHDDGNPAVASYVNQLGEHLNIRVQRSEFGAPDENRYPAHPVALVRGQQMFQSARAVGADTVLSGWGGDQAASFGMSYRSRQSRWFRKRNKSSGLGGLHPRIAELCVGREQVRPLHKDPDLAREQWLLNGHISRMAEINRQQSAAYGIEFRYPLLDQLLVEWCLARPASLWLQTPLRRDVFREAFADKLPAQIAQRPTKNPPRSSQSRAAAVAEVYRTADQLANNDVARHYFPGLGDPKWVRSVNPVVARRVTTLARFAERYHNG